MNFAWFDTTWHNPCLGLALDEALCLVAAGRADFRAGLRVWANPPAVVLGRTDRPELNLAAERLAGLVVGRRGRPRPGEVFLCRRASGGGTVVHGPGNLNFSLFFSLGAFPRLYPVKESYTVFLGMIARAIARTAGIRVDFRGDSDLIISGEDGVERKISGNAQFRKRGVVVHHGTLLVGSEPGRLIQALLRHPPREPAYRAGRTHGDFLAGLPADFDARGFYEELEVEVAAYASTALNALVGPDRLAVFRLARNLASRIYVAEDWILRGHVPR